MSGDVAKPKSRGAFFGILNKIKPETVDVMHFLDQKKTEELRMEARLVMSAAMNHFRMHHSESMVITALEPQPEDSSQSRERRRGRRFVGENAVAPYMEGWMKKKGQDKRFGTRRWQDRYFVLDKKKLVYRKPRGKDLEIPPETAASREIKLRGCKIEARESYESRASVTFRSKIEKKRKADPSIPSPELKLNQHLVCITLPKGGRTYLLQADTKEDADEWVTALRKTVQMLPKMQTPSPDFCLRRAALAAYAKTCDEYHLTVELVRSPKEVLVSLGKQAMAPFYEPQIAVMYEELRKVSEESLASGQKKVEEVITRIIKEESNRAWSQVCRELQFAAPRIHRITATDLAAVKSTLAEYDTALLNALDPGLVPVLAQLSNLADHVTGIAQRVLSRYSSHLEADLAQLAVLLRTHVLTAEVPTTALWAKESYDSVSYGEEITRFVQIYVARALQLPWVIGMLLYRDMPPALDKTPGSLLTAALLSWCQVVGVTASAPSCEFQNFSYRPFLPATSMAGSTRHARGSSQSLFSPKSSPNILEPVAPFTPNQTGTKNLSSPNLYLNHEVVGTTQSPASDKACAPSPSPSSTNTSPVPPPLPATPPPINLLTTTPPPLPSAPPPSVPAPSQSLPISVVQTPSPSRSPDHPSLQPNSPVERPRASSAGTESVDTVSGFTVDNPVTDRALISALVSCVQPHEIAQAVARLVDFRSMLSRHEGALSTSGIVEEWLVTVDYTFDLLKDEVEEQQDIAVRQLEKRLCRMRQCGAPLDVDSILGLHKMFARYRDTLDIAFTVLEEEFGRGINVVIKDFGTEVQRADGSVERDQALLSFDNAARLAVEAFTRGVGEELGKCMLDTLPPSLTAAVLSAAVRNSPPSLQYPPVINQEALAQIPALPDILANVLDVRLLEQSALTRNIRNILEESAQRCQTGAPDSSVSNEARGTSDPFVIDYEPRYEVGDSTTIELVHDGARSDSDHEENDTNSSGSE